MNTRKPYFNRRRSSPGYMGRSANLRSKDIEEIKEEIMNEICNLSQTSRNKLTSEKRRYSHSSRINTSKEKKNKRGVEYEIVNMDLNNFVVAEEDDSKGSTEMTTEAENDDKFFDEVDLIVRQKRVKKRKVEKEKGKENVQVVIRMRPFNQLEKEKLGSGQLINCVKIENPNEMKLGNPIYLSKWGDMEHSWKKYKIGNHVNDNVTNKQFFKDHILEKMESVTKGTFVYFLSDRLQSKRPVLWGDRDRQNPHNVRGSGVLPGLESGAKGAYLFGR